MLRSLGVWTLFRRPEFLSMSFMKNLSHEIVSVMGILCVEEGGG